MSVASVEPRRRRSGALFNNRYFADVAAAALDASEDGTTMFTTRMVASSTGLADSVVRPVLHRLVDAHVLSKLPRAGGGRSAQYYQVIEATSLGTIRELAEVDMGKQTSAAAGAKTASK